jgi:hypothetical protein
MRTLTNKEKVFVITHSFRLVPTPKLNIYINTQYTLTTKYHRILLWCLTRQHTYLIGSDIKIHFHLPRVAKIEPVEVTLTYHARPFY